MPSTKQCSRCLWSGKLDQLLNQDDDDCQFEFIPADRFTPGHDYACFCCSMLCGFLESQGVCGRAGAYVIRDDDSLLLKKDERDESDQMFVFTASSAEGEARAPLSFLPHCAIISGDTSSVQALSWVQKQIDTCLALHERCKNKEGAFLPTRLLDIRSLGSSGDVVLVESERLPSSSKYVALSHCWGKFRIECLTKTANLARQMERIPWDSLTRTFQDAIDFTRRLDIDFIWIDSMCIIQDDSADWLKEAAMMFSVYHNAYVTLVGVHGVDGSVGLYSKSTITQTAFPNPIKFKREAYQLHARSEKIAPFHDWLQLPPQAPLFTRAWCYQERLISPRVVYFTKDEILWECFTRVACECTDANASLNTNKPVEMDNPKTHHIAAFEEESHDALRAQIMASTSATAFRLTEIPSAKSRGLSDWQARCEYRVYQWHNVVEQYSELELTKVTDRLPAIGAIAQHYFQQGVRSGEDYLAGLFSGSLVEDLLWFPTEAARYRLGAGVAPSWSWASVSGAVQYSPMKKSHVQVISAECKYPKDAQFGAVLGGTLVMEGSAALLTIRKRVFDQDSDASSDEVSDAGFDLPGEEPQIELCLEDGSSGERWDFVPDDDKDPLCSVGKSIHALRLADDWGGQTWYLLLAEAMSCYVRVGLLSRDTATQRTGIKLSRKTFKII